MNHYLHAKADDAAEAIENYISMHNLNPHDRIPSERAMAEELGINRTTCREALKRLENEHILYFSFFIECADRISGCES